MKITKRDVTAAFHTSVPIMVTFLVLGTGYGILMQKHGFGWIWSMLSGIVIFSGTVQFVSVSLLSGGSVLMALVTALMISARHSFFSISMIGRYRTEGKRKWYLFYALCDETYAVLCKEEEPEGVNKSAYRVLVTLFTTVFIQQWIDSRCHIPALLGLGATFACRLLFGKDMFLIPAMAVIIVVLIVMRKKIEAAGGADHD